MKTKKGRKPRGIKLDGTRSMDMCPHCYSFHCDPMCMSRKFQDKMRKRSKADVCRACGHNPCKCKSELGKRREQDIIAEYDNRYWRHFKEEK